MRYAILASTLIATVAATVVPSPRISYDGHKVYRVKPGKALAEVRNKLAGLDLKPWKEEFHRIDVPVSPDKLDSFHALGLDCSVMHENLGHSIKQESAAPWKRQVDNSTDWYASYHSYDDNAAYFKNLQTRIPNNSEILSIGTSYEGRDLFGIHIWGDGGPGKPAILNTATVHAREWIATPVAEYITEQIIDGYNSNDTDVKTVLNTFDVYVFPIVNPDGFEYSRNTDRQWRKNRQPAPNNTCVGTDINRNWPFQWNPDTGGSSSDPCDETYAGTGPSSAPENAAQAAFVAKLKASSGIKLYIDWHSYGQKQLYPYGYNETILVPQLPKWERTGNLVTTAIQVVNDTNSFYQYGPGGAIEYKSVGNGRDHVYGAGGADFSYTWELPDTGVNGFVLPPDQIRPIVEQTWTGQLVLYSVLNADFFNGDGSATG